MDFLKSQCNKCLQGPNLSLAKIKKGKKTLAKRDKAYQARWDKIWSDPVSQKHKRSDHDDYWLWNHEFFEAEIADLYHIAAIIGAKLKEVKHP